MTQQQSCWPGLVAGIFFFFYPPHLATIPPISVTYSNYSRGRGRESAEPAAHTRSHTLRSGATEGNARTVWDLGDPSLYSHSHDHNRFRRCGPTSGGLCCCSCSSRSSSALKVRRCSAEADSHLRRGGGTGVCRRSALMRRAGWLFTHGSHLDRGARAARGSDAVRRWQSGWREVRCRTRVQIQGENDLVEGSQGAAQFSVFAAAVSDS